MNRSVRAFVDGDAAGQCSWDNDVLLSLLGWSPVQIVLPVLSACWARPTIVTWTTDWLIGVCCCYCLPPQACPSYRTVSVCSKGRLIWWFSAYFPALVEQFRRCYLTGTGVIRSSNAGGNKSWGRNICWRSLKPAPKSIAKQIKIVKLLRRRTSSTCDSFSQFYQVIWPRGGLFVMIRGWEFLSIFLQYVSSSLKRGGGRHLGIFLRQKFYPIFFIGVGKTARWR